MKKVLVSIFILMLIAASSISPAKAAVEVQTPFKGKIQGVELHEISFPNMYINGNGSGNSTLLGNFTLHYEGTVYLPTASSTDISAQFTSSNGDVLYATGNGKANPTSNISYVTEWYTITGGTGRFAGAKGSFTLKRQVNRTTGAYWGTYSGWLILQEGQ
jgi:hypothetical protein